MGISPQQAVDCFASDDLIGIGMEADAVRRTLHPEGVVTYDINAFVPCTNDPTTLDTDIEDALSFGATGITLVAPPVHSLTHAEDLLRHCKTRFPVLHLHAFSPLDLHALAAASGLLLTDVLTRLKTSGLDSIASTPCDAFTLPSWLNAHRAAHLAGISSSISLVFGPGPSGPDFVAFLQAVYALQQETRGFQALTLVAAHAPSGRDLDDPTAIEYLRTLSICRMLFDNIPHVQSDWQQQGLKVLQMGLRFGGDDIGSIFGPHASASEEEVRRIIRDAGFQPVQRDTLYRTLFLN